MQLTATVTRGDVVRIIESLTPMRITLDERRGRSILFGRPQVIELVKDTGLRLRGDARITWDIAGVPIPVTIQAWQVVLVPRIATRGRSRVLSFEPIIEELDLKLVPGFLDDKITNAIREGIAAQRERIAWDFARTLSKSIALPTRITTSRSLDIVATNGVVSVTDLEMRLSVSFETCVQRRAPATTSAAAPESRRGTSARAMPVPAMATTR